MPKPLSNIQPSFPLPDFIWEILFDRLHVLPASNIILKGTQFIQIRHYFNEVSSVLFLNTHPIGGIKFTSCSQETDCFVWSSIVCVHSYMLIQTQCYAYNFNYIVIVLRSFCF